MDIIPYPKTHAHTYTYNITAAGAVDREFVFLFYFCLFVRPKTCSRRAGRGLKRSLEAVGFVLAEFRPKRSHGDPIRDIFCVNFQDASSQNIIDEQNRFV